MDLIYKIAKKNEIMIVEDACHALGTKFDKNKMVGCCSYSDFSTFSFHPVKTIAMGEGGVITTNNKKNYERLTALRNHGMSSQLSDITNPLAYDPNGIKNPWFYEMHEVGFNYRSSDINCALGLSQLKKLILSYQEEKN